MQDWQVKTLSTGLALVTAFALSSCTPTGIAVTSNGNDTNVQTVPSKVTSTVNLDGASALNTNLELENRLINDYDLIKQVSSQISPLNIYDEGLQPVNKTEKCLVPFIVNDTGANVQLYWDGECSNGIASGLGRLVRTVDGKKTQEFLMEIDPKVKDKLVTYLNYDTATGDSEVGYGLLEIKDNKLQGFAATWGYNHDKWLEGTFELTARYEDTTNFVSYTKIVDLLSGEYSAIIAYPNFSHDLLNAHDNVLSNIDKTYRLLEGRTMIGLSYIWLKDGRLLMRDNSTGQDHLVADHPQELDKYVQELEAKVDSNTSQTEQYVDQGFAKIEEYSTQKCRRPLPFFRGDEVNQICDYAFNVSAAYDELLKAQEVRSNQIDSYREGQEERVQRLEQQLRSLKSVHLTAN